MVDGRRGRRHGQSRRRLPPPSDWALNGTFTATSNGEWAATNDVFHNEQSVRSIWTISTQCSYPTECTGTVTSDFGWTAPIYQTGGEWYVKRVIPNWMPCFDGSVARRDCRCSGSTDPARAGTTTDPTSDMLVGSDATTGQAGRLRQEPAALHQHAVQAGQAGLSRPGAN